MKVRDKLRAVLKDTGIKQCVLAERCGLSPQVFSDILTGRRKITEEIILKLCAGLDTNPNDLLSFKDTA